MFSKFSTVLMSLILIKRSVNPAPSDFAMNAARASGEVKPHSWDSRWYRRHRIIRNVCVYIYIDIKIT
jgi:hypothetical protein